MAENRRRRGAGWRGLLAVMAVAMVMAADGANTAAPSRAPVIAAAADLQFALGDVAGAFLRETGQDVRLTFGSSGNFARQIRQGAPFEMFLSADEDYVLDLMRDGFTRNEGDLYAIGRIAILVPTGSPLRADGSLEDLRRALNDGRLTRFAIANPEHAPYGQRAEEALRRAGLWEAIESRLVLGENVAQAAQFALSGSSQGGIVAYALALSPRLASQGAHAQIPAEWHSPLRQRMVLLRGAGAVAESFYAFARSPEARAILRRYGFLLPGEQS